MAHGFYHISASLHFWLTARIKVNMLLTLYIYTLEEQNILSGKFVQKDNLKKVGLQHLLHSNTHTLFLKHILFLVNLARVSQKYTMSAASSQKTLYYPSWKHQHVFTDCCYTLPNVCRNCRLWWFNALKGPPFIWWCNVYLAIFHKYNVSISPMCVWT